MMPYSVTPMTGNDIAEVEVIERQSFSSPWSRRAYEYDLGENPLAHYFVVRQEPATADGASGLAGLGQPHRPGWWDRVATAMHAIRGALHLGLRGPGGRAGGSRSRAPVLGFAGVWMAVGEAHLVTIAVAPQWRRLGLGELLLVNALGLARQLGASAVFLEVRLSNAEAKRLYEKYGFTVGRIRKGYYSDNGEDALEMVVQGIDGVQYQSRMERLSRMLEQRLSDDESPSMAIEDGGEEEVESDGLTGGRRRRQRFSQLPEPGADGDEHEG
jgi:ribosomal-protein-alanine N-acetyltransferase